MKIIQCQGRGCKRQIEIGEYEKSSESEWARTDYHGIYTGLYCNPCYANNYPYRKDNYEEDAIANGERIEPLD